MRRSGFVGIVLLLCLLPILGCGRGSSNVRLSDIVPITTQTLGDLLVGDPNVPATQTAPVDKPLLSKGVYESVVVAADGPGFAHLSKGALTKEDVYSLLDQVVSNLNRRLKRSGFSATKGDYPPAVTSDKTLIATLTPQIQEGGSSEDRVRGQGKTLILVRLSIANPKSGEVLAQRDYYSGTDARRPGETRSRQDFRKSDR